jgi:hypothetical protein
VTPLIVAEMAASVLFELLVAIFSFSIALYTLVTGIFYQGADIKPLLTASFGQIMPMLLLIVIALTAVEVGSESVTQNLSFATLTEMTYSNQELSEN